MPRPVTVEVNAEALATLVQSVEEFWADHQHARIETDPGWIRDRDAIAEAKRALRR